MREVTKKRIFIYFFVGDNFGFDELGEIFVDGVLVGFIVVYSIWHKSPIPPSPSALDIAEEPPLPLDVWDSVE